MSALLFILLLVIGSIEAGTEWSQWSLCTRGCSGGERSRFCLKDEMKATNSCQPLKIREIEQCKKELCKSTDGFSSSPVATKPPETTTLRWSTSNRQISNCQCGCTMKKERGSLQVTFKKDMLCTWKIEAKKGYFIQLTFNELANFDWKNGGLYIAGPNLFRRFNNRDGEKFSSKLPLAYTSKETMNFTLQSTRLKDSFGDIVLDFKYMTYPGGISFIPDKKLGYDDDEEQRIADSSAKGGTNVILIASIGICVGVIIIAIAIIFYRRTRSGGVSKTTERPEEGIEDCSSSIAGSNRSARQNKLTSPRKDRNNVQNKIIIPKNGMPLINPIEHERLMAGQQHGYPSDGQDVFIQGQDPTVIPTLIHNGQPYINWPMHLPLINQANYNYPPKHMSFEHITQPANNLPVYYPNSGTEG